MTNREWLESLEDKELAHRMASVCFNCVKHPEDNCEHACDYGIYNWLSQEYTKPKEFTKEELIQAFRDKFIERRAIGILEIEDLIKELYE